MEIKHWGKRRGAGAPAESLQTARFPPSHGLGCPRGGLCEDVRLICCLTASLDGISEEPLLLPDPFFLFFFIFLFPLMQVRQQTAARQGRAGPPFQPEARRRLRSRRLNLWNGLLWKWADDFQTFQKSMLVISPLPHPPFNVLQPWNN